MSFLDLSPVPLKHRGSMVFVEKGRIDVKDGAFCVVDEVQGERMLIPCGSLACILLEPGTRVSHQAVKLAAQVGTLLIWVGEGAVRLYSSGLPGGSRSDKLLHQARLALSDKQQLAVVRKMFSLRFKEEAPSNRSIAQLRGIEGARVRQMYKDFAKIYKVPWAGRKYDVSDWDKGDIINQCLSTATSCLYGISEAAILAAGYSPAIGFLHSGRPLSFVYDIADIFKFDTVVPVAFEVAASKPSNPTRLVRRRCRDVFRSTKVLEKIIPVIENVLNVEDEVTTVKRK